MKSIEERFFRAFCIPADKSESAYFTGKYNSYPDITDAVLLKLLCIYNKNMSWEERLAPTNFKYLKHNVLYWLIIDRHKSKIYSQVRKLFGVKK